MKRVALVVLMLCACARAVGWYRADLTPTVETAYDERFQLFDLTPDAGCPFVRPDPGPVIVMVPGIGGDGDESRQALPLLMAAHPPAVFMFRYDPFEELGPISDRLAAGLTWLLECRAGADVLVMAHSAGGVAASFAVSKIPPNAPLTLLTVASPLNGTTRLPLMDKLEPRNLRLMALMGLRHSYYPSSAAGIRVVHLRTSGKSDDYMKPAGDFIPNDPKVGVPGAPQIDLPEQLDHAGSLVYVAGKVADGSWQDWLGADAGS